ncbi:hypothetical protein KC19_11G018800 [Ceratodon purpureus]|uniref:Uncharacterized protein n=1 Tax=Ceratodon purpureus TaxID=3225 RepID=A0A8T0G9I3_CERPU|nr:hypothetical protein KC19_11G018800 [Ceratodon purpureus]
MWYMGLGVTQVSRLAGLVGRGRGDADCRERREGGRHSYCPAAPLKPQTTASRAPVALLRAAVPASPLLLPSLLRLGERLAPDVDSASLRLHSLSLFLSLSRTRSPGATRCGLRSWPTSTCRALSPWCARCCCRLSRVELWTGKVPDSGRADGGRQCRGICCNDREEEEVSD